MIQLLLAASLGLVPLPAAPVAPAPDSLVVERLVSTEGGHRVPQTNKMKGLAPGDLFTDVVGRLEQNDFYKLSPDAIAAACGAGSATSTRFAIRVHDNAAWRELDVPDKCESGSPALQKELTEMRNASWDVLAGRALTNHPKP